MCIIDDSLLAHVIIVGSCDPNRFIKRLTNFFKPSNYIFTMIQYSVVNAMTYSVIGCSLVNFLIKTVEVSNIVVTTPAHQWPKSLLFNTCIGNLCKNFSVQNVSELLYPQSCC